MRRDEPTTFFNIILDSIADGVFTINDEEEITSFNRAAQEITGFSREEAVGQHCFDIFRTNICQTNCALRQTVRTGKPIINMPVNILRKNGKEAPVSISTAVLRDEQEKVIGAVETFRDLSVVEELRKELSKRYALEDIIGKNHQIQDIFHILPDIAESDATVLIQGPSGSGKELFARAIHNLSHRKNHPYVKVHCGALPDTLLESELFGYVKGAFTDAKKDKPGRFALAEGGTILLDEVGDMSHALQVKLLRILQEKEYEPLGGVTSIKADVRIVAATNKNLPDLVRTEGFREDLFYRLNVVKIVCHSGPSREDRAVRRLETLDGSLPEMAPEVIDIGVLKKKYMPARFPHLAHVKKLSEISNRNRLANYFHADKATICAGCHHYTPIEPKSPPPLCRDCHNVSFDLQDLKKPRLVAAYHLQCINCHKRMKLKPLKCTDCHAKRLVDKSLSQKNRTIEVR
ncbi:MAG: sigma 54-interacting transcriptional regulator [Syntrophales bacterium]|nr:sigma 54-interacting transcriptional regulator [Syntrophales bacterium]